MASKFQNRLVGTIVLVALSVIVLPIVFDSDKKYNDGKFASIPLVPKSGNEENIDSIPPLTQNMPPTPSKGAAETMQLQDQASDTGMPSTVKSEISPPREVLPPREIPPQRKEEIKPPVKPEPRIENKPETKLKSVEQAPQATAYVVQLGALKNAGKVDEILAKLRLSGHQVYTVPSSPVQGQLTRIYVGPNASRQKLESILSELREITGLQGQIKNYKP
ncbi:cell division protein DedD [Xenorhabdus vietnamensis]|uniref:Cell division protein DedD n=1 Tax=Xenorhabdus vietnamensis TaxID=351656 RepID=A0A1Y2S945_9GAMM|nr:cell division protein DedD [Xenorhabdus vietnamensis]OTA15187.1 cell division protein DedD [Xenorhabdus vietnamensis]OTA17238.1 cell division protein DedD [Xenorhabdus vietnamensis]